MAPSSAALPRRALVALTLGLALMVPGTAGADVRIKDIAQFEGVRENQLVGYGLVVGLDGTGDTLRNSPFTRKSIEGMLERLGVGNLSQDDLKTRNTAAVMVTAKLPAFSRRGSTIDVTVSSLGDATSLRGGTLIVTPLTGADGEIYAVGQGPVAVAGYKAQGNAASVTEGVPTVARVPNGAIVEREVKFALSSLNSVRLALRTPDFTTAERVRDVIDDKLGGGTARVLDSGTVEVLRRGKEDVPGMLAAIENLKVKSDSPAKVVIDEKTGTIVIGENVRIDRVAISEGGLTVKVKEHYKVSQPEPLSIGNTVVVPETSLKVEEKDTKFTVLDGDVSLQDLVDGLNAIGVTARQTISILQAIKAAGALHAELEVI
ncbi:flagellar basal body P-ring protein FlgI [Acidimangrovimonas sediminis]|uniref:flagellar basal body P-ring protein FlgI n=1 Tax=Acidimangrovimonas sediminis TaxID=2056283 RepID=UPI000C7FAB97|nr:flagellar basal body P-ring protein FlgI [Acidimangrovimonas sediminis]